MTYALPSILAIAIAAPGLTALDVADDEVKLGLSLQLQMRADMSKAETAAGGDYDIMTGGANAGDPADFYNRRLRFGLRASYKGDYRMAIVFAADKGQKSDQTVVLYEANLSRVWRDEAHGLTHELKAGRANAFYSGAVGSYASTAYLLPAIRATERLGVYRGNGVSYLLTCPYGRIGANIQNNVDDDVSATASDGLFYSARAELSPAGAYNIAKPSETFLGKPGTGVLLAVDAMANVRAGNTTTTTGYGIELLGHLDGLTALAEFRTTATEVSTTGSTTDAVVWLVQAGYAMAMGTGVIEPALRYQVIDLDTGDDREGGSFGKALDYGNSGTQAEVGVNYYIHGNNNKLQLSYTRWEGEDAAAGGNASADILRAQWQIWF